MAYQPEHTESNMLGDSVKTVPHVLGLHKKPVHTSNEANAFDRWIAEKMLQLIGAPPISIELWDGSVIGPKNSRHILSLNDRSALWQLLIDPEYNFGDLYSTERAAVDTPLQSFLVDVYLALQPQKQRGIRRHFPEWLHRPRGNTLTGSQGNIHHHYDLGNEFYKLWLDTEAMQYTCAYFPEPAMTLEQAQIAKLHHICRKLQLKPGDRVVEAGCGWGGLARFMARHYGVTVHAYNISHQQVLYARERAAQEGLSDNVTYVEEDYRNISGKYDVFVSVGMLEHVGRDQYQVLGEVIARCLKSNGRGLVHSIGRNRPGLMNAWIEKRIFPGAYPPSLKEFMDIFEPNGLSVQDVENLRLHYAKTLEHWLLRFEQHAEQVREMYDEIFVRAWRLYLAGSIAAFMSSDLQLFQVVFNRAHSNVLPWSRAHVYSDEAQGIKLSGSLE